MQWMQRKNNLYRRSSRLRLAVSTSIAGVALAVALAAICTRNVKKAYEVHFDANACIRLEEVSRIYKIRINSMAPDEVWFATEEGVRIFNEQTRNWTRYGLDYGLPAEQVADICFTGTTVWLATGKGVASRNAQDQRFITLPASAGERILSIESLPDGTIFYYAEEKGLYQYDPKSHAAPVRCNIPGVKADVPIFCLRVIDGKLWAGLEGWGFMQYDLDRRTWQRYYFGKTVAATTQYWDIIKHQGACWIATSDDGMWKTAAASDTLAMVQDFPGKGAYAFADDKDGFWCGTPWGLWRYYDTNGVWIQFIHPEEKKTGDFQVSALYNAGDVLWYGSQQLGAGYFNKVRVEWQPLHAGLCRTNVAALAALDSLVMTGYGYQGGCMDLLNANTVQFAENIGFDDYLEDPNIQCLAADGQRIYFGGYESFGYYDIKQDTCRWWGKDSKLPAVDIADILCQDQPPYYLASLFGVLEYFPARDSFPVLEATRNYRITSLCRTGDSLWFGTLAQGLKVFDLRTRTITGSRLESAQRIVGIAPVRADGSASLFVATNNQGCYLMNATGSPQKVIFPEKLMPGTYEDPPNHIMAMKKIDDLIWLGTRDAGCMIYDPQQNQWGKLTFYHGLVSDHVRAFAASRDFIWIGCYGGLNRLEKKYYYETKSLFKL